MDTVNERPRGDERSEWGASTHLGHMLIPAQVVVASEEEVRREGSIKGTTIHEALSHGRVIAES